MMNPELLTKSAQIAAIALILAIIPFGYWYYQLLRVLISLICIVLLVNRIKNNELDYWILFFVLSLILFQPIEKISFDKTTWRIIDFIVAILFYQYSIKTKHNTK